MTMRFRFHVIHLGHPSYNYAHAIYSVNDTYTNMFLGTVWRREPDGLWSTGYQSDHFQTRKEAAENLVAMHSLTVTQSPL